MTLLCQRGLVTQNDQLSQLTILPVQQGLRVLLSCAFVVTELFVFNLSVKP